MSRIRTIFIALSVGLIMVLGVQTRGAAAAPVPEVAWERLEEGPDLAVHAMILDRANDMLWIFGGITADPCGTDFHNEVWRLDLKVEEARWQLARVDGLRPPPLIFHSATYDPLRQEMLVYGGQVQQRGCFSGDTNDPKNLWRLDISDPDNISWTRDSVAGNLNPRYGHAAVYVPTVDALVVSGGLDGNDDTRNDNWALLLGESPRRWERLANAGFAYRAGHGLIHDEANQRLLAYGGLDRNNRAQNLLDALDISGGIDDADRWLRVRPANPSPQRSFFAHGYDAERQLWWMQGGFLAGNRFQRDLQVLDLSGEDPFWTNTQTVYNGPLDRFFHVGVWDALRQRMIVHGGTPDNNRTLRDTRAMVYQGLAPDPTATATTEATATWTSTATATASATTAVEPTSTPTATTDPAVTATATLDATVTATSSAMPPDVTATIAVPTATVTVTATEAAGPSLIFLPITMRNEGLGGDGVAAPTATPTVPVQDQPRLDVLGAFGGDLDHIAVAGDRVYASAGLSLLVIDISDPRAPTEVGRVEGLPSMVRALAANGAHLAVGMDGGTVLYDLVNPNAPIERSSVDQLAVPSSLALRGNLLLGSAGSRLRLFDVSNAASPELLSTLDGFSAVDLVVLDDRVVAVTRTEIQVVDITDVAAPSVLGSLELPSRGYAVDASGDRAAVALDREGVLLVDIADPAAPTARGSVDTPGRAIDLIFSEDELWVADSFGYVAVDATDPDAPTLLGEAVTEGFAYAIALRDGTVLVADGAAGLRTFDAATAVSPSALGAFDVAGRATAMAAREGLAVVNHFRDALRFLDISDPTSPVELAALPDINRADGLTIDGDRLYVADSGSMKIIDIADPTAPVTLGSLALQGTPDHIVIAGNRAYIADLSGGLLVVDVAAASAPVLLGALAVEGGRATGVAVDADRGLAFVAAEEAGLLVVDVSDPSAPSVRADLATERAYAVRRVDDRLYLGDGTTLLVVDVEDPDAPSAFGSIDTRGSAYDLTVDGERAWVAHSGGVSIYDIADPTALTLIAEVRPGARQFAVQAGGEQASAAGDAGLLTLQLNLP